MTRRVIFLWLALAGSTLAGCVFHGPGDVRRDLTASTGAEYEREFGMTLGRIGTSVARWGMRVAGEDDIPLEGVRKIEIGVYRVTRPPRDGAGPGISQEIDPGWSPVVSIRNPDEDVRILLRENEGRVRAMLIVVQDSEELVVVRMKGRLERMVEAAIRYGLEEAGKPGLVDDAVGDYRTRT